MPLASSDPHEDISVDVLGPWIVIWPMDLLGHGGVLTEAGVDGGVGVRLGPIIRVVGDQATVARRGARGHGMPQQHVNLNNCDNQTHGCGRPAARRRRRWSPRARDDGCATTAVVATGARRRWRDDGGGRGGARRRCATTVGAAVLAAGESGWRRDGGERAGE
jgi:hypothetical protein